MNTVLRPALILCVLLTVSLGACAHAPQRINALPAPAESMNNFDIDSLALHEMEKRLIARMASVARAEAAAVKGTDSIKAFAHHAAPAIKPNLLGAIEFNNDSTMLNEASVTRIAAMSRLAQTIPGALEVRVAVDGTGPAVFDVAMARARRVYLALVEANSRLGERPVELSVQTRTMLPGAPRAPLAVEVYIRPE